MYLNEILLVLGLAVEGRGAVGPLQNSIMLLFVILMV
jgi:hypothetical protein